MCDSVSTVNMTKLHLGELFVEGVVTGSGYLLQTKNKEK